MCVTWAGGRNEDDEEVEGEVEELWLSNHTLMVLLSISSAVNTQKHSIKVQILTYVELCRHDVDLMCSYSTDTKNKALTQAVS